MRSNFAMHRHHRNANESKQSTLVKIQKHPPTIGTLNRKKKTFAKVRFPNKQIITYIFSQSKQNNSSDAEPSVYYIHILEDIINLAQTISSTILHSTYHLLYTSFGYFFFPILITNLYTIDTKLLPISVFGKSL